MTQEMASIATAILARLKGFAVYYNHVPEGYQSPAIYFPLPTVEVESDCLDGFKYHYSWFIKIFHKTSQGAWEAACNIQSGFKENRNLVPIIDGKGEEIGRYLLTRDVRINEVEPNTMQIYIRWDSHRGYKGGVKTMTFNTDYKIKMQEVVKNEQD